MAGLATTNLNLADYAKLVMRDGRIGNIANLLAQSNSIVSTGVVKEGNLATGHRVQQVTGLPTSYFRLMNQGYPSSKARTVQIDEQCAQLFTKSTTDLDMLELEGNEKALRQKAAMLHLESMGQKMADTALYGSSTNTEEFVGFMERYSSTTAGNGQNVITAGGTQSDNTSILLVGWGDDKIDYRFPKGSKAGITQVPLGRQLVQDANGSEFTAMVDEWKWKLGLAVHDWRYAVRICNIDVSTLIADPTAATINIINLMIKATHRIPNLQACKPRFYVNRTVREMLDIQAANKSNVYLTQGNEEGKMKTMFRGIPIELEDQIRENESLVS